jgi:hypothetical protein
MPDQTDFIFLNLGKRIKNGEKEENNLNTEIEKKQ